MKINKISFACLAFFIFLAFGGCGYKAPPQYVEKSDKQ